MGRGTQEMCEGGDIWMDITVMYVPFLLWQELFSNTQYLPILVMCLLLDVPPRFKNCHEYFFITVYNT